MGYPIKTVNLNIKPAEFRSNGSASKINVLNMVEHDFRQYEANGKPLPAHINPDEVKNNFIVYLDPQFQKALEIEKVNFFTDLVPFGIYHKNINNIESAYSYLLNVYEKEKKYRDYITEKYSWLKSTAPYFAGFVINFSKLAQKEIVGKLGVEYMSQRIKDFCLDFFEKIMGVRLIYLVGHFDESAPHFHGLITNFRKYNFQYRHFEQILTDPYFRFLTEKYLIADLIERLARGLWRTFSGTFTNSQIALQKSVYRLPFSFLQDITHYAFRDLGIERGKSKAERLAEGEPLWKLIARDVKTLHEDLPREIALKKEELNAILDTIVILNNEKAELEKAILALKDEKAKLEKSILNLQNKIDKEKAQFEQKVNELQEQKLKIKMEINSLKKEKQALQQKIKKLSQEDLVYSEDELSFLNLIHELIKANSLYELYEIFEKLKKNKLFQLMMYADQYVYMTYEAKNYKLEDIMEMKTLIKQLLQEKNIDVVEDVIAEELNEEEEKSKEKELERVQQVFKRLRY